MIADPYELTEANLSDSELTTLSEANARSFVYTRVSLGWTVETIADACDLDEATIARFAADCPKWWANSELDMHRAPTVDEATSAKVIQLYREGRQWAEIESQTGIKTTTLSTILWTAIQAGKVAPRVPGRSQTMRAIRMRLWREKKAAAERAGAK